MTTALIGRKVGMTRYFTEEGISIPVTVIEAGPCVVTQIKTVDSDGYAAIQIAFEEARPRHSSIPLIGHDGKAGTTPKKTHREIRMESDEEVDAYTLGQLIDVSCFEECRYVDVSATSKGKGFQGGMKRHNFKGKSASHGVKRVHRAPGSIGGHSANLGTGPKLKKGKRMAGQMGNKQVTVRSIDVISCDAARSLLLVKGPVPGPNRGVVFIREAIRLNRRKARAGTSGN